MFKKIGLRIRRVRMDQHIKQKDLAKKISTQIESLKAMK